MLLRTFKYRLWISYAHKLISKLSIDNDNYVLSIKVIKNHYSNADKIAHELLSKIAKFSFSKPNQDYSNFLSSMISLKVYLEEIKNEHKIDITAGSAERLVKSIVHDEMPPLILDEYRYVLNKYYPTFQEFIDNTHKIVSKFPDMSELNSKCISPQTAVNSTISVQESINIVGC